MNANKSSIDSSAPEVDDYEEDDYEGDNKEGDNKEGDNKEGDNKEIGIEELDDTADTSNYPENIPEPEDSDSESEHVEEHKVSQNSFLDEPKSESSSNQSTPGNVKYESFSKPKLVSKDKFSQLLETSGITITDVYYLSDNVGDSPLFIKMVGTNVFCVRIPQKKYDFPKIDNGIVKTYSITESSDVYDFFAKSDLGTQTNEIKLLKKRPIIIMGDTCICTCTTGFSVIPDISSDLDLDLINKALDERLSDSGVVKIEDWSMIPCINFKEFLNMLKTNDLEFEVTTVVTEISKIQEDTLELELAKIMKAFERAQNSIKLKFYTINSRRIETVNNTKKLNTTLLKFTKELEKLNTVPSGKEKPISLSVKKNVYTPDPTLKMKLSLKTKCDLIRKAIDQNVKKTATLYNELRDILKNSIKLIETLDINS